MSTTRDLFSPCSFHVSVEPMVGRAPLLLASSLLVVLAGACTLSTAGIDTGETGGAASTGSTTAGSGGSSSTTTTTTTTTTTGTGAGGSATCSSEAECPPPAACVKYACSAGACVPTFAPLGTPVVGAPPGPCKALVCDGQGASVVTNDDAHVPDDQNPCTADTCTGGTPKHEPLSNGTPCGGGLACNAGSCMGCTNAGQCPAGDACKVATCVAGTCGFDTSSTEGQVCSEPPGICFDQSHCAAGTCVPTPKPQGAMSDGIDGNCKSHFCDGSGMLSLVDDDADTPPDGNANDCTIPGCAGGAPTSKPSQDGQNCGLVGQHCCAGNCQYATCCAQAQKCGLACCAANEVCGNNGFCCAADKICGGACCDPAFGVTCVGGAMCCFNNKVCGNKCCGALQACVNGACI
jgi:hypothetical protein